MSTKIHAATSKTHTTKTWGRGDSLESSSESKEGLIGLVTSDTPESRVASITCGLTRKVSDSVYWGDGAWDKVPFSVEVFTSVTLNCTQNPDKIETAKEWAYRFAWDTSQETMGHALVEHVKDIKGRLFKDLF